MLYAQLALKNSIIFNIDPTNVLNSNIIFQVSVQTLVLDPQVYWYFFKTILWPTSVDLIFYAPNVANLGFWRIVLTIAL